MSKYTIEVYSLLKDNNFKMFDFDYSFYTDNEIIKSNFENKFLDTYMFHELGQETVMRFKHYLRAKLNNIMPYYRQLYETELRCQDIDFMLNKDLTETFERINNSDKSSHTQGSTIANVDNTTKENTKESYLEQGLASISTDDKLTGVTNNTNTINQNANNNSEMSSVDKINNKEITKLISQGNIGVTSSAELLDKWRKVIINIDNLIIEECSSLFMQIY